MKKFRVFLFFAISLLLLTINASAQTYSGENYSYTYEEYSDGITLTSYDGKLNTLSIPDTIGGVKVVKLADKLFYGHDEIVYINPGSNLKYIGDEAFFDCSGLLFLTLPDSVGYIGARAFAGCTGLIHIEFGYGIKQIGSEAFSGCSSLEDAVLPYTTESVGDRAFADCVSLEKVIIANDTASIGKNVFPNVKDLKVYAPAGSSVHGMSGLTTGSCNLPGDLEYILSGTTADLTGVPAGFDAVVVPDYVNGKKMSYIRPDAFLACKTSVVAAVFPNVNIAFTTGLMKGMTSLEYVSLPKNGLTYISNGLFMGCASLRAVYIPGGVSEISEDAFNGCTSLKRAVIPGSVRNVRSRGFCDCSSLLDIYLVGGVPECDCRDSTKAISAFGGICADAVVHIDTSVSDLYVKNGKWYPNGSIKNPGYTVEEFRHDCFLVEKEIKIASCASGGESLLCCQFCGQSKKVTYGVTEHKYDLIHSYNGYNTMQCRGCGKEKIVRSLDTNCRITASVDMQSGGNDIVKQVFVEFDGVKLTENIDYTLSYTVNDGYNRLEYTVTGIGDCIGENGFAVSKTNGVVSYPHSVITDTAYTDKADGHYSGDTVKIYALPQYSGYNVEWVASDNVLFLSRNNYYATFIMPDSDVTINAGYTFVPVTSESETTETKAPPITLPSLDTTTKREIKDTTAEYIYDETTGKEDFGDTQTGREKIKMAVIWGIVLGAAVVVGGGFFVVSGMIGNKSKPKVRSASEFIKKKAKKNNRK